MSGEVARPRVSLRKGERAGREGAAASAPVAGPAPAPAGAPPTTAPPTTGLSTTGLSTTGLSTTGPSADRGGSPASLFGDRWTGPAGPPPAAVPGAVAATGVIAAVAVPEGPTGVGWLLTALVATGAVAVARWRAGSGAGPDRPAPLRAADLGWVLLAVALTAVGTVRAAPWLAALCLLAALAAAALAVAGRSFRGVPASLAAAPAAALRAVPWLARGVRGGVGGPLLRTAAAGVVGLVLLLVFGALLTSADAAFGAVVDGALPRVDADSVSRGVVLFVLAGLAAAGACFLLLAPPPPSAAPARRGRLRLVDWALPVGLLVVLFTGFVAVQFVVLFGGAEHVLRTAGMTYAEYARQGFWQLLAVTVLALAVLAFCSRVAPAATAAQRAWKRGLLGSLANLTLVIVVSALNRMWLYQEAYGFTVLRLVVLTCELWLGVGFLLALVSVLRLRPAGLTRPMVAAGMLALLALAVLDPERFIAEHNVSRWQQSGRIDLHYLGGLSVDAVPPLLALPDPMRGCVLGRLADRSQPQGDWRAANVATATYRSDLPESRPEWSTAECAG